MLIEFFFWCCTRWPNLLVQVDFPNEKNSPSNLLSFSPFFFTTTKEIVITITTKLAHVPNDEDHPLKNGRPFEEEEIFLLQLSKRLWTRAIILIKKYFSFRSRKERKRETDFFVFLFASSASPAIISDRLHVNGSITQEFLLPSLGLVSNRLNGSGGLFLLLLYLFFCSLQQLWLIKKRVIKERWTPCGSLIFINSSRGAKKDCVCVCVCPGPFAIACLSRHGHILPPADIKSFSFFSFLEP